MGGSSKKQTVGYKYYLGLHMVLCHGPLDSIRRIDVDGKTAWSGENTGGRININKPELFGGEEREGGVSGALDIEMGSPTQGKNDYLESRLGPDVPSYRGVVSAVLRQMYVGNNPYIKRWSFWATRIMKTRSGATQWYSSRAQIGNDMNPAHIIRECLTDSEWGMGYNEGDIDNTSFVNAANQLYSEGMGMSLLWDRSVNLDEFIQEVLHHIDGALFVDRNTGLFCLSLARGGYNIENLLVLDEASIQKISNFKRRMVGELTNSVTVVYWDGQTGKNNSVTVQDIALAASQGTTIGTTIQYPGFTKGELASRVASRDLRALSNPMVSADIYADRKAASLNIGDVFVLSWPRYGVEQMVMRVSNIELGSLENNLIKISAIEDVFSLSDAVYASPPPSEWQDPNHPPAPCPHHFMEEAGYWELVQRIGESEAQSFPDTSGYAIATGVRPSSDALRCSLYSYQGGVYEESANVDFCPMANINTDITPDQESVPLQGGVDLDMVRVGSYAEINGELVEVKTLNSSYVTLGRGVLDTVPKAHPEGSQILFVDDYAETDAIEYSLGEDPQYRLLPSTGLGTLPLNSAPTQTVEISARHNKPYPPGGLRINGTYYPNSVPGDQDITFNWYHRNRLQQTATLVDTKTGNIGPEPGTTYELRVYQRPSNTLILELNGTTSLGATLDLATLGNYYGELEVQLWSVRDGIASHQKHVWNFVRSGYGTVYGLSYGGA